MRIAAVLCAALIFITPSSWAATYSLPPVNEALIGNMQTYSVASDDTLIKIATRYDVGFNALENANPHIDVNNNHVPYGTPIQIPTEHLLPNRPRVGIIVNLPEMRMYYFPEGSHEVLTYPIGIGKVGKTIPIIQTAVTRKAKNPTWIPPNDIREYNLEKGIVLPPSIPPGPDNPLGPYAIYMRLPTYLIHSTIFPESIGRRASFGCIRMYEQDIEDFFPTISKGIPVAIINAPVKVNWQDDKLYMEAHPPLIEHKEQDHATLPGMVKLISRATNSKPTLVDWQLVSFLADERDGIPHEVGMRLS